MGRVPEPDEPHWLDDDRDKVLAFKIEEALRCPICGTREEEWIEDHNAYYAERWRCVGCEKLEWEQHATHEEKGSDKGMKYRLKPKG